jgi:catechol 2,3-dioxygenase
MATLPMDVEGVVASAPAGDAGNGMAAGTTLGHVHLQVASISEADAFYTGAIGFDAMVRGSPGALFVSAGGYHHHIGLNTWAGEGAPAPPQGARGLRSFTIVLPDEAALRQTLAAARDAGIEADEDADGRTVVTDPSGNRAVLATR